MKSKLASVVLVSLLYVLATLLAWRVVAAFPESNALLATFWADVAATLLVFAASVLFRNASLYDPYWSVIPVLIVCYWAMVGQEYVLLRQWLVVVLVVCWGTRLTWNWLLRWQGMADEDWRYRMLRQRHGRWYPLVNFGGIHILPTLLVFAGTLAAWPALGASSQDLNLLDLLALLVTGGGIVLEMVADRQLRRFKAGASAGAALERGLWSRCRHPNYLGEILFWWGLYLFALAANPAWWWTFVGALAINLLFVTVSIPMMDSRMLERYPVYAQRVARLPALVPRPGLQTL